MPRPSSAARSRRAKAVQRHEEAPPRAVGSTDTVAEPAGPPVIAEPVPMPPIAIAMPVPPTPHLPDRFAVALVSSQRGVLMTRRVPTWDDAFAAAHRLLDEAEDRDWHHGEVVSVRVETAAD
jgi:hypothetical protein